MSDIQQLLNDYQQISSACQSLFGGWLPAEVKPVRVTQKKQFLTADELQAKLETLSATEGWLLFSDRKVVLKGKIQEDLSGRLLSADLYQQGVSIRIRETQQNQWLWLELNMQSAAVQEASHIATEIKHFSTEIDVEKLIYQQLWCRDSRGRMQVEDAIFQGFEGVSA